MNKKILATPLVLMAFAALFLPQVTHAYSFTKVSSAPSSSAGWYKSSQASIYETSSNSGTYGSSCAADAAAGGLSAAQNLWCMDQADTPISWGPGVCFGGPGGVQCNNNGGASSGGGSVIFTRDFFTQQPSAETGSITFGSAYYCFPVTSGSVCALYESAAAAAPTASLTANPSSIVQGNNSSLTWSSTNATSCTGQGFSTGGATSGTVFVSPSASTDYEVDCTGSGGTASGRASVTVTQSSSLAASCSASPTNPVTGQTVTWSAAASGASSPYSYSWSGDDSLTGSSASVSHAYSSSGTKNASVTVTSSATTNLQWVHTISTAACAAVWAMPQCDAVPSGSCSTEGQVSECNAQDVRCGAAFQTYQVYTCRNVGASASSVTASCSVPVTTAPPTVTLTANPTSIIAGNSSTLAWTSTNATSASINNGVGSVTPVAGGSVSVSPQSNTTYTITATGPGGTATASITVSVNAPDLTAGVGSAVTDTVNQAITLSGTGNNISATQAGSFPNILQVCDASCATIDTLVAANTISSLAANSSAPLSASYTPITSGTLYYRFCANETTSWTNVLPESNYGNNCSAFQTLTVYQGLSASCSASPSGVQPVPVTVTWTANATGGSGGYSYAWGGNVSGSANPTSQPYSSPGTYSGQVTVTDSVGHTVTQQCSPGGSGNPITGISCTASLTATPNTITQGQSSTLSWSVSNGSCASSCTGQGFSTGGATSGSASVSPSTTSSYAVSCGVAPTVNATVTVIVPTVTLTANPDRVVAGGTTALTWTSTNTKNCTVTRNATGATIGTGTSGTNVPDSTPITAQTVYTANCTTNGAPVSATAIVNIQPKFQEF